MRIQDPVWKDCYIEIAIKDGMFNMSAAVRLMSLLEMYLIGFIVMFIMIRAKRWWRKRHEKPT